MGIKELIKRTGTKAADKVANLAALSPAQLEDLQKKREAYLSQLPDPGDTAAIELTLRLIAAAGVEIYNAYLPKIQSLYAPVATEAEYGQPFHDAHNIRYIRITKWVTDKSENSLEKLVNVYEVLSNEECNIGLVFHRRCEGTEVYLAVTNTRNADDNVDVENYKRRLVDAIRGNFPGLEWEETKSLGRIPCLDNNKPYSVAAATNVPTEKSEKFISQTIEKLLDGIVPESRKKEYILILLATPVQDIGERKLRLASLYSGLAPYASWETDFQYTESDSTNSMATFGVNAGVSAGVQRGANQAITTSQANTESASQTNTDTAAEGTSQANSDTESRSESNSQTHSEGNTTSNSTSNTSTTSSTEGTSNSSSQGTSHAESTTNTWGVQAGVQHGTSASASASAGVPGTGVAAEVGTNTSVHVDASYNRAKGVTDTISNTVTDTVSHSISKSTATSMSQSAAHAITEAATKAVSKTAAKTVTDTVSKTLSHAVASTLGKAVTNTVASTQGISKAINMGGNFGANFARSSNVTATVGKGEGLHQHFTNYTVKHTLELLEEQMKRYEQSTALGMWDFAAYVLSEDQNVANNVAHTYLALTQGENSYMSQTAISLWRGDMGERSGEAKEICSYLRELRHPLFGLKEAITYRDHTYLVYPAVVTPTTALSGKELSYSLNFPRKAIAGLPVIECAEFGRNVVSYDLEQQQGGDIVLGNIFHMNHKENIPVKLKKESMSSHTFVTGSTGSGKTNTVLKILEELREEGVHFLVVEPAKGEYKYAIGGETGVSVYGTNPSIAPMLRINPFSFPKGIHVFEHLDRLVEIFNVCWPMYAAMPAVLKHAIEQSYRDCGWDMIRSVNPYGENLYPGFTDVVRNIRKIIDSSEYDAENKGAYKGALITRLESLTNGINSMLFTEDEIAAEELFDRNVIVDISRIGSMETKSLIMGMLVLKLQEYRMTQVTAMNAPLRHVTVLEEAHNLLKRVTPETDGSGSGMAGKSVEMIGNAIAEMRTYGEGFIISDQAPGLLDMAVIRNTNTKILMRLPDLSDRELAGHAAGLNDEQIIELAKLPRGVAAVYQNEWIQPVLCKVDRFEQSEEKYQYSEPQTIEKNHDYVEAVMIAVLLSHGTGLDRETAVKEIGPALERLKMTPACRVQLLNMLDNPPKEPRMTKIAPIMAELFPEIEDAVRESYEESRDPGEWTKAAESTLYHHAGEKIEDQVRRDIVQGIITHYCLYEANDSKALREWREKGGLR